MSSVYTSAGTSRRRSREESPSSFTPPEFHYDDIEQSQEQVDLDSVFRKLEKYQAELQQVEARLVRQRSFSSRQAEEVAAATRFKLDLEKLEQFEFEDEESPSVPHQAAMPPPRKSSMYPRATVRRSPEPWPFLIVQPESNLLTPKRRTRGPPEPIMVPRVEVIPQDVESEILPPRISSKPVHESETQAAVKSHRRHITISEGRGSARNMVLMSSPSFSGVHTEHELPPLPSFPDFILPPLSPSSSVTTAKFSNPPATPLSLCPPSEDQIRREIELFSLRDGGESLVGNQYKHRALPELVLDSEGEDETHQDFREVLKPPPRKLVDDDAQSIKSTKSVSSVKSLSRRRKSIFAVFQRKNEVDKLLDLYFDDDKPEEKPVKRRQSLSRRMTRSRRNSNRELPPDIPPLPPMPIIGSYRPG